MYVFYVQTIICLKNIMSSGEYYLCNIRELDDARFLLFCIFSSYSEGAMFCLSRCGVLHVLYLSSCLIGLLVLQVHAGEVVLRSVDLARLAQVRDTCSTVRRDVTVTQPHNNHKLLKHLIVDEKHKIVFCYVPKVACSNWKRIFMILTQDTEYSDPSQIPAKRTHLYKSLDFLGKYVRKDIKYILKNYKKILFVRHPFDRLFSAYRSKFMKETPNKIKSKYGTNIIKKYRDNPSKFSLKRGHDVTFKEFSKYISNLNEGQFEPHWETINEICQPCLVDYDFIGKIETMDSDSDFVLSNFINDSQVTRFPGPPNYQEQFDMAEYYSTLNLNLIQKLYNIYEIDFKLFGYKI